MPLSEDERARDWIHSDDLPRLPRQSLAPEQAEKFLDKIFERLAVKPSVIRLNEGARVARYLKALALSSEQGRERQLLMQLAENVWGQVLEAAPIQMATKQETVRFLKRHIGTYFNHPQLGIALAAIRKSSGPKPNTDFFPLAKLASRTRATQGPGVARIANDLSERIYAAYHALRRAGMRGASGLVAEELNRKGHRVQTRGQTSQEWGAPEVYERVKQYQRQFDRQHEAADPKRRQNLREGLVDKWIFLCFARANL